MELLESAIRKLADGTIVEMRFDHDEGGSKLADIVSEEILAPAANLKSFSFVCPPESGTDWNDYLRNADLLFRKQL